MNTEAFKDREIKSILGPSSYDKGFFDAYIPDWAWQVGDNAVVIEYENSSRGCVTHVAKYIDIMMKNPNNGLCVCIVRSQHHIKNHHQDFRLASALIELAHKALPGFLVFFYECDGTGQFLKHLQLKQLSIFSDDDGLDTE